MILLKRSRLLLLSFIFPYACALFGQTHPHPPTARQRQQQEQQRFQAQRQSPDQQPAAAHLFKAWQAGRRLPVARRTAMSAARGVNPHDATANAWQELGPKPLQLPYLQSGSGNNSDYHAVSGIVTALAVDLVSDPTGNTVYVGTEHGGLWKSVNALAAQPTFVPLTDSLPASSIGSIAVDATTQPATLYVGTGDQDGYQDSYLGAGIVKSTDGGKTWSIITSADNGVHSFLGLSVDRIVIDPANPQHLVAATQAWFQAPGAPYPETGIYASSDGGATWSLQQQFPDFRGWPSPITDLVYDPVGKIFYAAVLGMGIYTSPDGKTWTATNGPLLSGYPVSETTFDRASLAVRNGTLYVLFCTSRGSTPMSSTGDTGLVETTDQGKTWAAISVPPPTQQYAPSPLFGMGWGNFSQFIAAPPHSSTLILGGLDVWTTAAVDGAATTWTDATAQNKFGEIQHAIAVISDSAWVIGTSTGLWDTQDGGQTWNDLNDSLATIGTRSVLPSGTTAGGYLLGYNNPQPGMAWTDGTSGWTGTEMIGPHLAEDPSHPARLYESDGGTAFEVSNDGGKTFGGFFWGAVEDPSSLAFDVIPGRPWELAASTCRIWVGPGSSTPAGTGWHAVSPNLTVDNPADGCPRWNQSDPQPPPGIALLASAPSDPNTMYAVTTNGRIEGSTNLFADAPAWTHLATPALSDDTVPGPFNTPPVHLHPFSALAVSPSDPKTVYLGVGGFGTGHLFKSPDGGATWTDISGNLPDAPLNSILLDPESPSDLYVATDAGVFVATDGGVAGESWQQVGSGLPAGPVLQIAFSELGPRALAAATFGRGLWTIAPLHNAGDFDLRVSPDFAFQVQSKATTLTASIDAVNGYNGTVTLSCSGISSSCTTQPAAIQPGQTATITINSTTPSDGILTLSATDGTLTHTQSVRLQTSSIALSPASLDVIIGDWYYSYIGVGGINLPEKATLSCGTLPTGVTCNPTFPVLDPSTPGGAEFAIRATSDAAPGSYHLQVSATAGDETLTAPLTVNVRSFTLQTGFPTAAVSDPSQSAKFSVYANMAQTAPVSVALSCSGAPGITCTFNPATITNNNGTSTVIVSNLGALTQPLHFNVVGTVGQEQQSVPLTIQLESWSIQAEPYGSIAYLDPGSDKTMFRIDYTGSTDLPWPTFTCDAKAPVQCSVQPGGSVETVNLSGLASLPADTKSYSFTVSATDGAHTQTVPLGVTFGFVEYQTPVALTQVMKEVDTASYTLTSTPVKNYNLPIQLTCSAPQGVTCALSPATMQPGDTATIAISGLASQPAGDVVATVTANTGVLHTPIKFVTRVADFALTSPTPQQNLASGADSAQFVIKATGLTIMRGPIQLGCQSAGPVQCSFSPANIVAGASSVLTVSGLSKATPSNDQIAVTVTGTAGVDAHTLALALQVPDFAGTPISSGSGDGSSQSVSAGQTAQYSLTYQSMNGFSGNVAMSCSGAPAQATCSVTPASFNLTPGGAQAVNVAVSTSAASARPPAAGDRVPPVGLGLLLLAAAGLLLATVPRPRRLSIAGAVLLGAMLLVSCGGGGGGSSSPVPPPAKTPTPSGTTTLTITATANGVAHATQLTLTVK